MMFRRGPLTVTVRASETWVLLPALELASARKDMSEESGGALFSETSGECQVRAGWVAVAAEYERLAHSADMFAKLDFWERSN
jgi:hypothetical protein